VPSGTDGLEELTDLTNAGAAAATRLTALADLLDGAVPSTGLVEDRAAGNTLAEANNHRSLLRSCAEMKTSLKVIFIPL
jgi:hypothetical protein